MSLYSVINGILFKRKVDTEIVEEFHVPFMFNRWFTMYDPVVVPLANELNRVLYQITDKQTSFKFLWNVIPQLRYKKIDYIKKTKATAKTKAVEEREARIKALANNLEISQREARVIVEASE